jgi:hypothetical protein
MLSQLTGHRQTRIFSDLCDGSQTGLTRAQWLSNATVHISPHAQEMLFHYCLPPPPLSLTHTLRYRFGATKWNKTALPFYVLHGYSCAHIPSRI